MSSPLLLKNSRFKSKICDVHSRESPSGKALVSGTSMRRFESCLPNQKIVTQIWVAFFDWRARNFNCCHLN